MACTTLVAGHALSFLITKWSITARAWITTRKARSIQDADCIRIIPHAHRGQGDIVTLNKREQHGQTSYTFCYQRDTYIVESTLPLTFSRLPYLSSLRRSLGTFLEPTGLTANQIASQLDLYGRNEFNIPIPSFSELFGEHATAPFFVFQVFCVALWCLDEYWYYSIFTLLMLVVFECTVVWQRVRTLTEFRTMSVTPYPIHCYRDGVWCRIQTDDLLPGDLISIAHRQGDSTVPADVLLIHGSSIVNEAMLSGESTPLLKESIQASEHSEILDADGDHKNAVLFSGTKVLQATPTKERVAPVKTPDNGCLGVVLRTGFGTSQGQLVRTMIFSTERISANNFESFLFIGFLLVFAVAASWYVWVKGVERNLKKSKLLLDCVLIITSVVPPELPMELSLAVNASLVALSKFTIFCTEPFRIPFAGRIEVCCFDKTGTITGENLVLQGVAGVCSGETDQKTLIDVKLTSRETTLCLAAAHALVKIDDNTVIGDPMEKATLEALQWTLGQDEIVFPSDRSALHATQVQIRRRFQFSSSLKRMSTISSLSDGKCLVAVKGAPETIKSMLTTVPKHYDETFNFFTRSGSRVLALGVKETEVMSTDKIARLTRGKVESNLHFAGFLVFHCPLKPDAVGVIQMLADSSHRCIMITGDNPLTAVHVAREVEIVDREVLILDVKENEAHSANLMWRTVDETKIIPVDPSEPLDTTLFDQYDICITGAAMKRYESHSAWPDLVQNTWVYARVSPAQKEFILTSLKTCGYTTLMVGDGTNDVGALKQAHVGVALLNGTPEDLQKIAERQKIERIKRVYETQLKVSARFNQPPPPVPSAIAHFYPNAVQAQQKAAADLQRTSNPMEKFNLTTITDKLAEMEGEEDIPKLKLGDASCAAPFTSKLYHVAAVAHIIRQGRCTLVATIQMYKILALNCLITAYSLSVQYLDGIKFGDYQVTITGMLMSICFLCISRAKAVDKLARERPLGNIFNFYVLLSVLLQFALHIVALVYITNLSHSYEMRGPIDLEAKFEPSLLNTAVYLLSLSQQVSTFAINFQGRPFREGIQENSALWWGLVSAGGVAFSGATDFLPELNRWLQIVEMQPSFQVRLTTVMIVDFIGCWVIEKLCKFLFADLESKPMVIRGRERRENRRRIEQEKREKELAEKMTE